MGKAFERIRAGIVEMITMEKLRRDNERLEEIVADAYQVIGSLAHHYDIDAHVEIIRAMDYLAYDDMRSEPITPWPRVPLPDPNAEAAKYAAALRAIIERADTDKPGTSKVQDMRRLAVEALGG